MFHKWNIFFTVFIICRDARYGNFLHLPFEGGVFEQPIKTMVILQYIQSLYLEKLQDEQKNQLQTMKHNQSRISRR